VLREQLRGRRIRYTDAQRRRRALAARKLGRKALSRIDTLVTPETLLRWYSRLMAKKYDGTSLRGTARPRRTPEVVELVLRMVRENSGWGYTRIRGALHNVGYDIGRNTIQTRVARRWHGSVARAEQTHVVERLSTRAWGRDRSDGLLHRRSRDARWLVRYHVLFVLDLASRRDEISVVVHQPHEAWMKQAARNLTDMVDGFLRDKRSLMMDRDPVFTAAFRSLLTSSGVMSVRLPARSPNLNAYAERFVRSVREGCLSKIIPLSETHLREVLREYVAHYHAERNHQGLANTRIAPSNTQATGRIVRRKRIGGMLNYYYREAA
jgi:putative transposase